MALSLISAPPLLRSDHHKDSICNDSWQLKWVNQLYTSIRGTCEAYSNNQLSYLSAVWCDKISRVCVKTWLGLGNDDGATAAPRAGSGPEPEAVKSSVVKMEESKAGNIVHVDHGCTHFPQYFSELNFDYRNVRTNPRFTFTKNVKWHFQSPTFDMESPTPQIPLKKL